MAVRRRRRERIGTVVLTALIVGGISLPATAEPPPGSTITAVPDGGARPATFGENPMLPTSSLGAPANQLTDPLAILAAQRSAASTESEVLAERINELKIEHDRARIEIAWAQHTWTVADEKLKAAKEAVAAAAREAYQSARELPPQFQSGSLVRDLDLLQPRAKTFSESSAYELERAVLVEQEAAQRLENAKAAEKHASEILTFTIADFNQRHAAFQVLDQRYRQLEAEQVREQERLANRLASNYDPGKIRSNQGLKAAPAAQAAVRYALAQLGKPYRFAEEGPTYYDCSGLVQAAYDDVPGGLHLPRVSRQMYPFLRDMGNSVAVNVNALLPGDLVFYARSSDTRSIYHVAMYLGDSKVVHATSTGDVVKISRLNFGPGGPVDFAARVIDAVPDTTAQ
jgi:peptidoglycan DL-endopeptidase CwlO